MALGFEFNPVSMDDIMQITISLSLVSNVYKFDPNLSKKIFCYKLTGILNEKRFKFPL